MADEFYGPTVRAVANINRLLGLVATGREQDWEFEFADPKRIQEVLDLLLGGQLDDERQSAAALLMLASIDEAGFMEPISRMHAAEWFLLNDKIRRQMQFYWIHLKRAEHVDLIKWVLGQQ
jgi:hypothetical protein